MNQVQPIGNVTVTDPITKATRHHEVMEQTKGNGWKANTPREMGVGDRTNVVGMHSYEYDARHGWTRRVIVYGMEPEPGRKSTDNIIDLYRTGGPKVDPEG